MLGTGASSLDAVKEEGQKDERGVQLASREEQCGEQTGLPTWVFNYC